MTIALKPTKGGQATKADAFVDGAPDATARPRGVVKGKKRQITLTISHDLLAKVDALAEGMGQARAAIINMAIYRAVDGKYAFHQPENNK